MNLTLIRKSKGLTQQELADYAGVTRQMISAIERGNKTSPPVAKKIAEVLGFDWTEFFKEGVV